jgi:hypothetical protein
VRQLGTLGEYAGNDAIVAVARARGLVVVVHQLECAAFVVDGRAATSDPPLTLHLAYHDYEHCAWPG